MTKEMLLLYGCYAASSVYSYYTIQKTFKDVTDRVNQNHKTQLEASQKSKIRDVIFSLIPGLNLVGALFVKTFKEQIYDAVDQRATIYDIEEERKIERYELKSDSPENENKVKVELHDLNDEEKERIKKVLEACKEALLSTENNNEEVKDENKEEKKIRVYSNKK